jgi:hypothetical protein
MLLVRNGFTNSEDLHLLSVLKQRIYKVHSTNMVFKSSFKGWNVYPNLTFGYIFPNFSISLKSDLLLVLDQTAKTGNVEVTSSYKTFSGYSFTVILEQPLWKDNFFVIAFKSSYVSFFYPIWITFSTFNRFFYIPEVIFSFNL